VSVITKGKISPTALQHKSDIKAMVKDYCKGYGIRRAQKLRDKNQVDKAVRNAVRKANS